ncbi:MAG: pyridoxal phosphate-dependent aminotransferase [Candidatus Bathyarchaeota archaeon]|nr:MAG: pyridoxal phosphate-dependent aminotransferase [Candidatus Bathyarchaeota archaeon]
MFMVPIDISQRIKSIRYSGIRKLFDLAQSTSGVVSLGIGEPDYRTPEHVIEAAKEALELGYTHYTPNAGFLDLRIAITEKMRQENNIVADPKTETIVTVGGAGAIFLATTVLLDPGDEVLIPDPGFVTYEPCIVMTGGIPVPVPVREKDSFRMLPSDVEDRITDKTKCIILNSPQNPTGGVLLEKDLRGIAQIAIENNLAVISDEVYEKLLYDGAKHLSICSFPEMAERTITVNSFSKTYAMTGWRVGYAVGPPEIVGEMVKIQQNTVANAPAVAQRAALAALKGPQNFVYEMVKEYDQRRRYIVEHLNDLDYFSCTPPKGAFYIFANISKSGLSSMDFAEALLRVGKVATVPGTAFGDLGEGYLRLCYATPVEKIGQALEGMRKTVGSL